MSFGVVASQQIGKRRGTLLWKTGICPPVTRRSRGTNPLSARAVGGRLVRTVPPGLH